MCTTCGCSEHASAVRIASADGGSRPSDAHPHAHPHTHAHEDAHEHARVDGPARHASEPGAAHGAAITLEREILGKNARLAERNRSWLESRGILALNLMSSPGAGKTTLLERTLREVGGELDIAVVEGDQETAFDAERLRATGRPALQINTGTGCHLEAAMLAAALEELDPPAGAVVMIENVGNLVCPALFDLGERARVAILSVTEGDDKPLKYPHMFRSCDLMLLNKLDLLEHVQFDLERCIAHARRVNPAIECLSVSATTGAGMPAWYDWLRTQRP